MVGSDDILIYFPKTWFAWAMVAKFEYVARTANTVRAVATANHVQGGF